MATAFKVPSSPKPSETVGFVRNAWYVAAWSTEIEDGILGRMILHTPIALFRQQDGQIAALLDICPHKFAPLSLGKRVGDGVQCGYHGLEFDAGGRCVRNPQGNQKIPPGSQVATFPVVERHGAIWIWPGEPALADVQAIPDFGFFSDPAWKAIYGLGHVEGNYKLSIDNLMDLGHGLFLHKASAGDFGDARCEIEVGQEGEKVWDRRLYPSLDMPEALAARFDVPAGAPMDVVADIEWLPAGLIQNLIAMCPPGKARVEGNMTRGMHCLTPETETSTHYFFANVRNFLLNDPRIDEGLRRWQKDALQDEDSMMVSAVERNTEAAVRLGVQPIYLSTDNAGARVRRVLETLVRRDNC